ncbi:hypothetical protein [Vibrio gigantis]|uniref:Lipoprotein n=1 Tax=Vibrio gigantis TaxID=296199 RepID=A0A5M9P0R8_9VIBR|nr:hypothetical protein [Vibrio gigantis]KAA8678387.1 hypothetical protein F4W18_06495 [Vibrio gigantis]
MAKLRTFGIAYVALALFGCGSDDSSKPALVEPIQDIAPSTPAELSNFINSIIKPENEDAAQVYADKLKSGSIQETQQAAIDILAYAQNNLQVTEYLQSIFLDNLIDLPEDLENLSLYSYLEYLSQGNSPITPCEEDGTNCDISIDPIHPPIVIDLRQKLERYLRDNNGDLIIEPIDVVIEPIDPGFEADPIDIGTPVDECHIDQSCDIVIDPIDVIIPTRPNPLPTEGVITQEQLKQSSIWFLGYRQMNISEESNLVLVLENNENLDLKTGEKLIVDGHFRITSTK